MKISRVSNLVLKKELIRFIRKNKRTPSHKEMKNKRNFSLQRGHTLKRIGSFNSLVKKYSLDLNKIGHKYFFNYRYFDKINTDAKAYFLGLIATDGSVRVAPHYSCRIQLNKKDKNILHLLKKEIGTDAPLKFHSGKKSTIRREDQYSLTMGDKDFFYSLKRFGFYGNKTFNLKFPTKKQLPKKYVPGFIRGVFDGDGTVHKRSLQTSFVSGSRSFLYDLKKVLAHNKFKNMRIAKRNKYNFYELYINASAYDVGLGWESLNKRMKGKMIRGSNLLKFYQFIYKNMKKNICLKRKKKYIETLLISRNRRFGKSVLLPGALNFDIF